MPKDSARKEQIRERMERTGEKYTQAARALEERPRLMLPLPEPVVGVDACRVCSGCGVEQWAVVFAEPDAGAELVCPVLCGSCHGCGRAGHVGCVPRDHDDPEEFGLDPFEEDDDQAAQVCGSCRGRRWWPMQGFDADGVYYVRVPCGCSEALLVAAP